MTLKLRNRFFIVLFVASLCCIATAAIIFFAALHAGAITPPEDYRVPAFLTKLPFARYHFTATMLSITILVLYVPVTVFFLLRAFENTQSSEIIFFAGFLLSCLCEGIRILIPLFGLGLSFSQLQLFSGRVLFIGRLLAPLSFVSAATMSGIEQRQDIERNFLIMIAISMLAALTVPLNTAQITTACAITWGFSRLFLVVRCLLLATAILSFLLQGVKQDSAELKRTAVACLLVVCGYSFLTIADNFLCMIAGTLLLVAGTIQMLVNLHTLYMWK